MRAAAALALLLIAGPAAAQLDPGLVGRWVLVRADSLPEGAAMAHAEMRFAADGACGMLSISEPVRLEPESSANPEPALYFDAEWDADTCSTADGQIRTTRRAPLGYALEGDTLRLQERALRLHLARAEGTGLDPGLVGRWEVESATQDGEPVPLDSRRTLELRADGSLVQAEGDRSEAGTYFTPEGFFVAVGEDGRVDAAGRYALEDGTLVIRIRTLTMRLVPEDPDSGDGE